MDFYQFTLDQPAHVDLTTLDRQGGSPLVSVLTLYDSDPQDMLGHRLLAQDDGASAGGDPVLDTTLGPAPTSSPSAARGTATSTRSWPTAATAAAPVPTAC